MTEKRKEKLDGNKNKATDPQKPKKQSRPSPAQGNEIQRAPQDQILDGSELQPTDRGIVIGPVVRPERSQAV